MDGLVSASKSTPEKMNERNGRGATRNGRETISVGARDETSQRTRRANDKCEKKW